MAQRYTGWLAHERMADGTCPECGGLPDNHVDDVRFWVPRCCDLRPEGVRERIEQFIADRGVHQA